MVFLSWKGLLRPYHCQYGLPAEWVRATWVCRTWRQVALQAAALWSYVVIWRRLADDRPTLEVQLDRANGVPLDMWVLSRQISYNEDLEEILCFVLSKTKAIKNLRIECDDEQQNIVKEFIKDGGRELKWLSVSVSGGHGGSREWHFSPDAFPRLRHLTLSGIVPVASAPLPSLIRLNLSFGIYHLSYSQDPRSLTREEKLMLSTRIHRFLAACPNLESLQMMTCFAYPEDYDVDEQPVIPLPKLRYLSLHDSIFQIPQTLGSLRLHPSASFHIEPTDLVKGSISIGPDDHYIFHILPQNLSQTLPPIRHTRRLALTAGHPTAHSLSLRGTQGPSDLGVSVATAHELFEQDPGGRGGDGLGGWSLTLPDLRFDTADRIFMVSDGDDDPGDFLALQAADPERARFYFLRLAARRVLARIPHLVVPARLVELQLHLARGLLFIARARGGSDSDSDLEDSVLDTQWVRLFGTMPHLRTLGIGGGAALIGAVLKALNTHHCSDLLCGELQDLALCAPNWNAGSSGVAGKEEEEKEEKDALVVFLREVVGSWARERARATGTRLRSLAVRISIPGGQDGEMDDLGLDARGAGGGLEHSPGEEIGFAAGLREDLSFLEDSVGEVMVETTNCRACGMEYEQPVSPDEEDAGMDEDGDGAYFY